MASLPTSVPYPRWVAPPLDRLREGRTRRHQPCPRCHREDGQCIALPPDGRLQQVWCVRGHLHPGGAVHEWGFRGTLWYFLMDAAAGTTLSHASQSPSPAWPQVDAGTLHRLLLRVARRFGLSAEHQAKLAARGYDGGRLRPGGTPCLRLAASGDGRARGAWPTGCSPTPIRARPRPTCSASMALHTSAAARAQTWRSCPR